MGVVRTLLAIAVVLVHTGSFFRYNITGGGQVAVQMFYMISGFYMALVLTEKYTASPIDFYMNRLLRLLPVYWAVCVGALIGYAIVYEETGGGFFAEMGASLRHASPMIISWTILSNVWLVGLDWLAVCANMPLLIKPSWTLGLEITFYALAPLLVRRSLGVLTGFVCLSIALRVAGYLVFGMAAEPWSYQFFPFELALFLAGALAYRLYRRIKDLEYGRWLGLSLIPGVVLFQIMQKAVTLGLPGNAWALVAFWAIFFAYFAVAMAFLFRDTRRSELDARLGGLSYPLYLVHFPLLDLYKAFVDAGDSIASRAVRSVVVLPISLGLAYLLARLVDGKMDEIRHRRARRSLTSRPLVALQGWGSRPAAENPHDGPRLVG
jgi:peptidoglycan/LPS O-acetylase OafA/YrhL